MKIVLDFSKVPLDKWVDLYESVDKDPYGHVGLEDVKKFAQVQVKEQSDYDKEIAEACVDYFNNLSDHSKYSVLSNLLDERKAAEPVKEDKVGTEVRSTVDLEDIPF